MNDMEKEFDQDMMGVYRAAKRECNNCNFAKTVEWMFTKTVARSSASLMELAVSLAPSISPASNLRFIG